VRYAVVEALGKRISTAIPIQHDMWLISLETMLMLYGEGSKGRIMEVHQELKQKGFLMNWRDIPSDADIVFVSHEWLSWSHPDPNGAQLTVLCRILERLRKGELDTEMVPMHTILYKQKFTTCGNDWKRMLKNTYLWIDWFSMPQPGVEKEKEIGKERMSKLRSEGSKAIQSIPAYVERSDFILVLVPGCHHSDRMVPTCFRTWRRRGWCLLELYASAMSRDSSNPPLLVRSERGTPVWLSSLDVMNLSIGTADFTCCQRNHVITTETHKVMGKENAKKIPCDKPIAGSILDQLIDAKVNHLFNAEGNMVMARLYFVFKHWWMRGGLKKQKTYNQKNRSAVTKFKNKLRWDLQHDGKWFDRDRVGILFYAVISDEIDVVRELLNVLKQDFKGKKHTKCLESRVRDEGYPTLSIPGGMTTLLAAMMTASPEVVEVLLEHGANITCVDVMGNDCFIMASAGGRVDNLKFWVQKVKNWNPDRQNSFLGSSAFSAATYFGAQKLETVKILLGAGAGLAFRTFAGGTALSCAVDNEDGDPELVRLVLSMYKAMYFGRDKVLSFKSFINNKRQPTTTKWKSIYLVARTMWRMGLAKTGLMFSFAIESGSTPLNSAVIRGDVEIVKLLLKHGADPYIENDLGMNAFEICERCGPFPSVMGVLGEHVRGEKLSS
jgi:ankyrin repeat protein